MNISATQFTLETEAYEIYFSGCNQKCSTHCHNKELWTFDNGKLYNNIYFNEIKEKIYEFNDLIKNIMIFGGEPLDQNKNEFIEFLQDMKTLNKKIWLFTSYEFERIDKIYFELCDYIKYGWYNKELECDNNIQFGIKLSTKNQKIWKK